MDLTHLVAAIVFGLIVSEVMGQSDRLAKLILDRAIKKLAKNHAQYYKEAWSSHLNDCPGPISRFRHACECWFISGTWRMEMTMIEYIAVKIIGNVGRITEWHASIVLRKAWLIEHAAKIFSEDSLSATRMNDAAFKMRQVATIQQQASRAFSYRQES